MKLRVYIQILLISVAQSVLFAQDANLVIPMGHIQKVNQIEVSYDFAHVASVDDSNIIHIWDSKSKREMYQLKEHKAGIVNIDFSLIKGEMASGDRSGNVLIWKYLETKVIKSIKVGNEAVRVKYLDDNLLVTSSGNKISIWNTTSGEQVKTIELKGIISAIDVSQFTGEIAAGTVDGSLTVLSKKLETIYSFEDQRNVITSITYFPDRDKLFMGYENGIIHLMNIDSKKLGKTGKLFTSNVGKILIDPKIHTLVAVGNDDIDYVKFLRTSLEDNTSSKFKWSSTPKDDLGLRAMAWADTTKKILLIADHDNFIREWDMATESWTKDQYKGTVMPILDIDLDSSRQSMLVATKISNAKIFDLSGAKYPKLLGGHSGGLINLDFHHSDKLAVVSGEDQEIKIWNTEKEEIIERIKNASYLDFKMQFVLDEYILRKIGTKEFQLFNFNSGEKILIQNEDVLDGKVSPNGSLIAFRKENEIIIYSALTKEALYSTSINKTTDVVFLNEEILVKSKDGFVRHFGKSGLINEFNVGSKHDKIFCLPNGEFILYASGDFQDSNFEMAYYTSKGVLKQTLQSHSNYVTKILQHNKRIITSSLDGTIKFWLNENEKLVEIGSFMPLWKDNYIVTTPSQLFDATPDAMSKMHYTRGMDIISLDQLKDVYYEPNLLPKLLGYSSGKLRDPKKISTLGIFPELQITHPNLNNGKLGIKITDKGGGIGRVVLNINGKEVASDVREIKDGSASSMGLEYDIKGHPYMQENKVNKITIRAYNKDGTLGSEPHTILVLPSQGSQEEVKPKIFALIIGSSDYASDDLDLKYAAKDAQDFAAALRISTSNLIGGENLNLKVLTTSKDKSEWPTKENIKKAFETFGAEAKARDYLIIYMAGHGVTSGGDFYYLTCTAKDGTISNLNTKNNDAISSSEFTELIKQVSALKQVMIVDACHSGTLTSSFGKTMDSEEVKALEKMKDRTGLFLLAGSAADAVSYETTLYGQGLLTYALLFGLKGAALREGEYVDVLDLFQFAATKVPQLAQDIGGIQRPEVRIPSEISSFDIGKMTDENKQNIVLLSPKPIFIQTSFQDIDDFQDTQGIGSALDAKLMGKSKENNSQIVYMNENKFGGAFQVRGRYEMKESLIIVEVKVFKDKLKQSEFTTQGTSKEEVSTKILNRLLVDYK